MSWAELDLLSRDIEMARHDNARLRALIMFLVDEGVLTDGETLRRLEAKFQTLRTQEPPVSN